MLFERFSITINYRDKAYELDIQEVYGIAYERRFEVIQGGITILFLSFIHAIWYQTVPDDLHPVVKHDTDEFISDELVLILTKAIVNHYDCFTDRKTLSTYNKN